MIYQFASWSDGGAASHNITAAASTTYTATFNEVPPTIDISDAAVTEGTGASVQATFTVTLSSARTVPVTVNYATANGTAAAGSDFIGVTSSTLTFDPGQTSKTMRDQCARRLRGGGDRDILRQPLRDGGRRSGGRARPGTITDNDAPNLGSDAFGYKAYAKAFESIDLIPGASGVFTIRSSGGNASSSVNLASQGSAFNFYGTTYSRIHVSTNGLITFGSGNTSATNSDLTASPSQAAMAPAVGRLGQHFGARR